VGVVTVTVELVPVQIELEDAVKTLEGVGLMVITAEKISD
jgi:hypothetical protein